MNRHRHCGIVLSLGFTLVLFGMPAAATAEDAYAFFERANAHFRENRLDDALIEVLNALQRDADLLPAHLLRARIALQLARPRDARAALERAAELGADENLLWPLRADSMLMLREFEEAVQTIPAEGFPPDIQSHLLTSRGHALVELGRLEEARESYMGASHLAPAEWIPIAGIARTALLTGDLYVAEARAITATRLAPDIAGPWNLKGEVLQVLGDADGALQAFDTALARDPGHVEARLSRAALLVGRGRLAEARDDLESIEQAMSGDPRYSYVMAMLLSASGAQEKADEWLGKTRAQIDAFDDSVVRGSPQLLMLAGLANFEGKQFERARAFLRVHVDKFPDRRAARMLLARVLMYQGAPEEAIQLMEADPNPGTRDAKFLALLAEGHAANAEHGRAMRLLEKALAMAPEDRSVRIRLALVRVHAGQLEQGLAELTELFREAPGENALLGRRLAALLLKNGKAAEALEVTELLLESSPPQAGHIGLHASVLSALGEFDDARAHYEQALSLDPGLVPVALDLAALHARNGDTTSARAVLEGVLEERPNDVAAIVALSRLASSTGDDAQALRLLEKAIATEPESVQATLTLTELHLKAGRARTALPIAERALLRAPEDFELLAATGLVYRALGQTDRAIAHFERLSEAAGTRLLHLVRAARLQAGVRDFDAALETLRRANRVNPDHMPARQLQIQLLARTGELGHALLLAQEMRARHPGSPVLRRLEGRILVRLGRDEEALAALEAAHRLEPSTTSVLDIARAYSTQGNDAEATRILREWVAAHPADRTVEVALAERLLAAGDYAGAADHLKRVLQQHGETASLLNNLAYALDKLGDASSVAFARRAHALAPESAPVADTLGWILVRRGEPAEALRYLRAATDRESQNQEFNYHLGAALAALGQDDEAREVIAKALRAGRDFPDAADARALLLRLSP